MQAQASIDRPAAQPDRICPGSFCQDRPADNQKDRSQTTDESTTRARVSVKRPAEEEADDSGRGDRSDWRNFVEPSSSSQAPSQSTPSIAEGSVDAATDQVGGDVISDVVPTDHRVSGGTKRPQEDHAAM